MVRRQKGKPQVINEEYSFGQEDQPPMASESS
jgi:hypothetical protein